MSISIAIFGKNFVIMAMFFSYDFSCLPLAHKELVDEVKTLAKSLHKKRGKARILPFACAVVKGSFAGFSESELLELLYAFQTQVALSVSEVLELKDTFIIALAEFASALNRVAMLDEATSFTVRQNIARANMIVGHTLNITVSQMHKIFLGEIFGLFARMTESSQTFYAKKVGRLAKKHCLDELVLAACVVRLANEKNTHIGEILSNEGLLISEITGRKRKRVASRQGATNELKTSEQLTSEQRQKRYTFVVLFLSFVVSTLAMLMFSGSVLASLIVGQLAFFIAFNNIKTLVNALVKKTCLAAVVPTIKLEQLDETDSTMVLIKFAATCNEDIVDAKNKIDVLQANINLQNVSFSAAFLLGEANEEQSVVDRELFAYAESTLDSYFFLRRDRVGKTFYARDNTELIGDVAGYVLEGEQNFFNFRCTEKPKYLLVLNSEDTVDADAVLKLVGAAKHPSNSASCLFALTEKVDTEATRRTRYTDLFSDSRGVYSDTVAASKVYSTVFDAAVFSAPLHAGAGLVKLEEFFEVFKDKLSKIKHKNSTMISAVLGTKKLSDAYVTSHFPSTFGEYSVRIQRYVFSSFELFPQLYVSMRDKRGNKIKLPPLYKFLIFDGINASLMNISSLVLLLFAAASNQVFLPVLLVIFGFTIVPLISLFNGDTFKSIMRAVVTFSLLPATFFLSLAAVLRAIVNLILKKKKEPATMCEKSPELFLLPNVVLSLLFFVFGSTVGVVCGIFWAVGLLIYYPLNQRLLPALPSKRNALLAEFGIIEPEFRIEEHAASTKIITETAEIPRYNLIEANGYACIFDECNHILSTFCGTAINRYSPKSPSGTEVEIDGERLVRASRTIFDSGSTEYIIYAKTHETSIKNILFYNISGEAKEIAVKNLTGKTHEFSVSISTEYALKKLDKFSNSTKNLTAIEPTVQEGVAIFMGEDICVAEFLVGGNCEIGCENGRLSLSSKIKIEAGNTAKLLQIRVAAKDIDALQSAIARTKTYAFLEAALRNYKTYESFKSRKEYAGKMAEKTRKQVLSRLMKSGLHVRPTEYFNASKRALNGLNDVPLFFRENFVLVRVPNGDINSVLFELKKLFKIGLNFLAVVIFEGGTVDEEILKNARQSGLTIFGFCEEELSKKEIEILELGAVAFVSNCEQVKENLPATLNLDNTQRLNPHEPKNLPRTEQNLLVGLGIAAVFDECKSQTLASETVLTTDEIFYFADVTDSRYFSVRKTPIFASGVSYSEKHENTSSTFLATSKTEKIKVKTTVLPFQPAKFFDASFSDTSGKNRKASMTALFEIESIRDYSIKKSGGYIELFNPTIDARYFIKLPEGGEVSFSFSRSEFFGRLNSAVNPRGVLNKLSSGEAHGEGCVAIKIEFDLLPNETKQFFMYIAAAKDITRENAEGEISVPIRAKFNNKVLEDAIGEECINKLFKEQGLHLMGFKTQGKTPELNTLATMYSNPVAAREVVLNLCRSQLVRGDMLPRLVGEIEGGKKQKVQTSPLFLPIIAAEYAELMCEDKFFETKVFKGNTSETIFRHSLRAVNFFDIGEDNLVLSKCGDTLFESILYFVAVKKLLPYFPPQESRFSLIKKMERVREGVTAALINKPECEIKMVAYLAGIFDLESHPYAKQKMEEFIDLWIMNSAQQKDFSALLYRLIVCRVLGVKLFKDKVSIRPKLLANLDFAEVNISQMGAKMKFCIKRTGLKKMSINGVNYVGREFLPLKQNEKKEIVVEI